jgi:hypothetical protein
MGSGAEALLVVGAPTDVTGVVVPNEIVEQLLITPDYPTRLRRVRRGAIVDRSPPEAISNVLRISIQFKRHSYGEL